MDSARKHDTDSSAPSDPYLMVQDLAPGSRIKLANGAIAEVTANPRDGMWIFVRYLSDAAGATPSGSDAEEMVFASDVQEVIKESSDAEV